MAVQQLVLLAWLGGVEVAVAEAPDPEAGSTGVALGGFEARQAVEALALVAVDVGPAAAQLGQFELAAGDEGVGEDAPVAVFGVGDRVGTEESRRRLRERAAHRGGGGVGAALGRVAGPDVLGGVDADQADVGELAGGQADPQGVAVDGVGDLRGGGRGHRFRRDFWGRGRRAAQSRDGKAERNDHRQP